jgi:hypothetical protein
MTTFFITYNTGEYDSYHDHVYTIDAESKKALYAGSAARSMSLLTIRRNTSKLVKKLTLSIVLRLRALAGKGSSRNTISN